MYLRALPIMPSTSDLSNSKLGNFKMPTSSPARSESCTSKMIFVFLFPDYVPDVGGACRPPSNPGRAVVGSLWPPPPGDAAGRLDRAHPAQGQVADAGLEDVLHLPEIVAGRRESVDCRQLVSRLQAFFLCIAAWPHPHHKAMIADHLRLPAIVEMGCVPRRQKECVGVVERNQCRCAPRRHGALYRIGCVDFRGCLSDLGVPVHSLKFRIVVVFFDVGRNLLEHVQHLTPFHFCDLLTPAVARKQTQTTIKTFVDTRANWRFMFSPLPSFPGLAHVGILDTACSIWELVTLKRCSWMDEGTLPESVRDVKSIEAGSGAVEDSERAESLPVTCKFLINNWRNPGIRLQSPIPPMQKYLVA